jgi:hypothetical protein
MNENLENYPDIIYKGWDIVQLISRFPDIFRIPAAKPQKTAGLPLQTLFSAKKKAADETAACRMKPN